MTSTVQTPMVNRKRQRYAVKSLLFVVYRFSWISWYTNFRGFRGIQIFMDFVDSINPRKRKFKKLKHGYLRVIIYVFLTTARNPRINISTNIKYWLKLRKLESTTLKDFSLLLWGQYYKNLTCIYHRSIWTTTISPRINISTILNYLLKPRILDSTN